MSDAEAVEEEKHIPVQMTIDHIKSGLSQIGKTFDGTSVSFITLSLENKELDLPSPDLSNYKNLRYVNLAGNHFEDLSVLSALPYILKLNLQNNRLSSLSVFSHASSFLYLQHLNLSKNHIQVLSSVSLPKLETLVLSQNQISKIEGFSGHSSLKTLDLRANKLASLAGLHNLTALENLWLAENQITSLQGISNSPKLKKIHIRKNQLNTLDPSTLPDLPSLSYLNMRENELVEVSNFGHLKKYSNLAKVVIADNPVKAEPSGDVKKEVLIVLPQLKFIGKEEVQNEEREEAIAEAAERKRLAEEARIEAERAAREALESGEPKAEEMED